MSDLCKVLIVDDEYIMRQGIKHLVNWDKEGFLIVGEATNGKEALIMVEELKPHIVVMDVVMPVMDGVELTKEVHEKCPDIKIIVLSGFDDFCYVKETLKNGAMDYILKPTLTGEVFLEALKRAADSIPGFSLSGNSNLNLNHALEWYIAGYSDSINIQDFPEFAKLNTYRMFAVDINYAFENDNDYIAKIRKEIRKTLNEAGIIFGRTVIDNRNLVYVFNYDIVYEIGVLEKLSRIAERVKNVKPKGFFVLSKRFENIQDVREIYLQVESQINSGFYYDNKSILNMEYSKEIQKEIPKFDYNDFSYDLRNGEYNTAIGKMRGYIEKCAKAHDNCEKIKNKAKNFIYNIIIMLEEYDIDVEPMRRKYFKEIEETIYVTDFLKKLDEILDEIKKAFAENMTGTDRVMNKITKHILEHYMEPLDLDSLAKEFNYNYNYLSSYFNSKNKEGFSGYLNKIRIEKSCEILKKEDIPISDVSTMVGYSDHSYFCRVFKKNTGYTPSVYRRRFR